MAFLKSKLRPLYLHFLDRELRRAENVTFSDFDILEFLIASVLNSWFYCYSSASLLQESNKLFPQSTSALLELEKCGFVKLLTNEHSFNEFIRSRREIYAHKESRYPMYFDEANENLWPSKPELIGSSTTSSIRNSMLEWMDTKFAINNVLSKDIFYPGILNSFQKKLIEERNKAITLDLLLQTEQLNNDEIRRNSGRVVSYFYTKRYLDLYDGDILSNLPHLSFYNKLSSNSEINDFRVLQCILRCCSIPKYFFTNAILNLEKLMVFLNSPYFIFFKIELIATHRSLVELSKNQGQGDMTQIIKLFESNFISQAIKIQSSPQEFLHQAYLALSTTALSLIKRHDSLFEFYNMAKQELTTAKRILIVTATPIETKTFLKAMALIGSLPTQLPIEKLIFWNFGIINNSEILMIKLGDMGSSKVSASTLVVKEAIEAIKPTYVIMLGIALGLKRDKHIMGTILVSRELEGYESAKISPEGIIQRGHRIPAGTTLISRFDSSSITYDKHPVEVGLIISGDKLIDNEKIVKQLKMSFPEAIGAEMEGTGLQVSSHRESVEWIVIKGICDWGYDKQNEDKERNQEEAIRNVCDYFIYTLKYYPI